MRIYRIYHIHSRLYHLRRLYIEPGREVIHRNTLLFEGGLSTSLQLLILMGQE